MKTGINILLGLIFILNTAAAKDKDKKEKKALVETIKKEYVISAARNYQEWLMVNFSNSDNVDTVVNSMENDSHFNAQIKKVPLYYKPDPAVPENRFTDFKFNIVNHQAVVQFKVDHQMKSAFLEKKNGQWKLIIAADLKPVL